MNVITSYGDLSPLQIKAAKAANDLYEEVCNQNTFSKEDIKHFLDDIKRVHKTCRECFNATLFTWQVDCYQLQMCLENENHFIFKDATMTWTKSRWKHALIHELAIHFYREETMVVYDFQLRLMCCWLLFQYFNTTVFKGLHFAKVYEMTLQIAQYNDEMIEESKKEIKQWREDNDSLIKSINYSKSAWRRELAKCKRLVTGCLKATEIELHHIIAVAVKQLSYEENLVLIARRLGVSIPAMKRRYKELGITPRTFRGYAVFYDECKAEYDKEIKWAEKVLTNSLTKKEKKEFWRRHRIYNSHTPFRTFTSKELDLTPASDPLETSDEQPREINCQDSFFGYDEMVDNVIESAIPPVWAPSNLIMAH